MDSPLEGAGFEPSVPKSRSIQCSWDCSAFCPPPRVSERLVGSASTSGRRQAAGAGGHDYISYKDQELETKFAKHLGVPLLLANVTQQVYPMARAAGLNKEDGSSIIKVFERMAGVTIGGDDD